MPKALVQLLAVTTTTMVTDDPNPWLLVAAAVVVTVLLLVLLWPRFRGSERASHASPPDPLPLAQQRAVERDMQTLIRELSEMARKIGAQLDAKSARLEALIRAADERAAQLESLSRAGDPGTNGDQDTNAARDGPDIVIPPPAPSGAVDADPRHAQIYALSDQGLSSVQIAERLGYNEGEIELILALRPPSRGRTGAPI